MTKNGYNEIIEEIRAYYQISEAQPGDVTTGMVANELGVSKETARTILMRMVKDGRLERVKISLNGKHATAYRLKK